MVNKITSCKAYHGFAGEVPLISFSRCKDTTSQEPRVRERPLTSVYVRERIERKNFKKDMANSNTYRNFVPKQKG
jgi:hypothetical protein